MSGQALTDAGVGRALFTTKLRLSLQAAMMCLWFGAMPGFVLPMTTWFVVASPTDVDLVKVYVVAKLVRTEQPRKWRVRSPSGERMVVTAVKADGSRAQLMTAKQVLSVLEPKLGPVSTFFAFFWFSLISALTAYVITWLVLRRIGAGNQESQRLRGAESLVSPRELDKQVRKAHGGDYRLIDVAIPRAAPMMGILAAGAQGSGKSLAIHDMMNQVFRKKRKCVIYDQSGEFFAAYFRPGKDHFFNPACVGSVPWSIFSELRYTYDADSLAQAFLPQKGGVSTGPGAFFEDAARALFSVILLRLTQRGARNTSDIAKAFLEMPEEEMSFLVSHSVASSAVGGDSKGQRQGVISSIAIYLNGIASVKNGAWSLRDFIEGPEDSRFFILGTEDTRAMFAPLYRLLLRVAFDVIAAKQEIVRNDRYWFFLDEVHTLGDIKLDDVLATHRKFGVCVVSGVQSESQFFSSMGKDRGETVMNCFNTVLALRANEPSMQERMAKRLGRMEMDTVSRNQALAVTEWRDGAGLNKSENEKWLVMPSEIGSLADCEGFLKLPGRLPAARVNYANWLPRTKWGRARATGFNPIQGLPPRDPEFLIHRAEHESALASVRIELEDTKEKPNGATKPSGSTGATTLKPENQQDSASPGVISRQTNDGELPAELEDLLRQPMKRDQAPGQGSLDLDIRIISDARGLDE